MEPIHAELFRLATELEAVKGQVQTECNALRDLHHVSERKREASALSQSAKCATVPIRHLCQVKGLITSACLKHSDVATLDNRIEKSPIVVHMKPFSTMKRFQYVESLTHVQLLMRSESYCNEGDM